MKPRSLAPRQQQRGVAALVVVMVLFFIVSLVAAYASRNMIFEQRTATNQYRSTQAIEAAEAGVEWALTMLNAGRIDSTCLTSADLTQPGFRDKYLAFDNAGNITVRVGKTTNVPLYPTCVLDGAGWSCTCPDDSAPGTVTTSASGPHPAFRVFFRALNPVQPGVVQLYVNGCTQQTDECLKFDPSKPTASGVGPSASYASTNEGAAAVSVLVGLTGGIASPPINALTARQGIDLGGAALKGRVDVAGPVLPTLPASNFVIHAGGNVNTSGMVLGTIAGSPSDAFVFGNDTALAGLTADRMFAATFNMWQTSFRDQPAAVVLNCGVAACGADAVRNAIAANPGRPLWINGDLTLDTAGDIGSATAPVLLNVTGNVDFGALSINVYGLVYVQAAAWSSAGNAQVRGAVIAQGSIGGTMAPTLIYDADVLKLLRARTGSFVRVPGSWMDFQ